MLELLRRRGPLTRGELGAISGLSRTTLYDAVASLVTSGALTVSVPPAARRKRGRPAEKLNLNPAADRMIGIDFARQAVRVAAYDVALGVAGTAGEPHGPDTPWEHRVDIAWRLVTGLTGGTPRPGAFSAVGVGLAGPMGGAADNLRRVLSTLVRERFGTPAFMDNNARLAALAESVWGAATGEQNVLYLHLSHGVGGGLIVNGALHRGAHGLSGELGHIAVAPEGAPCRCGGTGCLETVAGIEGILDAYRSAGGTARDLAGLISALNTGDRTAKAVLDTAGTRIGRVLAATSHVVGPRAIVIGGELIRTGPTLMDAIRRAFDSHTMPCPRNKISLRTAGLGESAAALGAVAQLLPHTPPQPRHLPRPRPLRLHSGPAPLPTPQLGWQAMQCAGTR
ncbi:ROK family protein [Streptomyces sp. NPDC048636]|uniref:ROK family transcriptional regulator n=1 Tax=Streptomyces sp. NPDC048636 TaxID=3155762 RepID=UPI0034232B66